MDGPSWRKKGMTQDDRFEEKVRALMFKRRITYQEAAQIVKQGQKSVFDF
ncbi:hypothetical protein KY362_02250 [Candidatus Woesearchaeota archaeon]|nr:hypothetical protein [Candidatus Woesearchaeota archaeon]